MQKSFVEDLGRHLHSGKLRLTKERRQLCDVILSVKGHFSAEDILKKIKREKIQSSRATLYRLLPVLVKAGLIQQSLLSEGQTQFEVIWKKHHHDHLICTGCNRVIEFHNNAIEILQREVANKYGFALDHHVMELVGRCRSCRRN